MLEGMAGLAERLRDRALEDGVDGLHPLAPLRDDRQLEAAGVLVELADQRVHARGVERGTAERIERGQDAHVGRVAPERPAAHGRELLDVVGADELRARFERDDVAQLCRRDLLGHDPHPLTPAVEHGGERAVDRGGHRRDGRRLVEHERDQRADQQAQSDVRHPQPERAHERAGDQPDEQRRVVQPPEPPAEQRHQQRAGHDPPEQRLRLRGLAPDVADRLDRDRRVDDRADHRPGPTAERGAGGRADDRPPDQGGAHSVDVEPVARRAHQLQEVVERAGGGPERAGLR